MLHGKKVILGVCGSIAAYKSALLLRLLVKSGAEVKVVMTPSASNFVNPLTFSTLSKNEVLLDFTTGSGETWNNHVELGLWADLILIAPATANTIAKLANGLCDNLLSAVYLSARCPVFIAPAMDVDMYQHPSTQNNLTKLKGYGNILIDTGYGELASGLIGEGRMAEPEEIITFLNAEFNKEKKNSKLRGKKIIVTAGPTVEPLDPVRFISNHSSGKMGYAIAEELYRQGAEVTLISGPVIVNTRESGIKIIPVITAEDMFRETSNHFENCDGLIMSAAVADYRPAEVSTKKIKKNSSEMILSLEKTPDILATLGKKKKNGQVLIGFALETENELEHARKKLKNKNADFIVLNSLRSPGAGFKTDTNKITIIDRLGHVDEFPLKTKTEVAKDIINKLVFFFSEKMKS